MVLLSFAERRFTVCSATGLGIPQNPASFPTLTVPAPKVSGAVAYAFFAYAFSASLLFA
jgi:hypothetical protein